MDIIGIDNIDIDNVGIDNIGIDSIGMDKKYWDGDKLRLIIINIFRIIKICMFGKYYLSLVNIQD